MLAAKRRAMKTPVSMHLAGNASQVVAKVGVLGCSSNPLAKLMIVLAHIYIIPVALLAFAIEGVENTKNKTRLVTTLGCAPGVVASELNDFIEKKGAAQYCAGDLEYSAVIKTDWLVPLRVVFGDAHFEALDDTSHLRNLKWIFGSAYFNYRTDVSGLSSLEVIGGDAHFERLTKTKGLENLRYVGGKVFYQGEIMSFSEFKGIIEPPRHIM